ncbi:MAG: toll/interleukin-1 receptor domain-containing protein [Candidatus Aminicenantes bacterium]|nr:MAG: toll/interleukin-1 receptor domain-containing protein [Candidatus Aminicenantes bacterium]
MKIKKKVFISYAREDSGKAKQIYHDLKSKGVKPWMDSEDLLPGQNWKNEIVKAIKESSYFLILLSRTSVSKKGYIQKEQRIAMDLLDELPVDEIYIIPVRLDECKPSYAKLNDLQWVDLFISYEKGIEKILNVIIPIKNEIPDELDLYVAELIDRSIIDISEFEKRKSWGDNFILIHQEFDGDETLYIFWDLKKKKFKKSYRSLFGTTWFTGYKLNQQDKQKIKKILNLE